MNKYGHFKQEQSSMSHVSSVGVSPTYILIGLSLSETLCFAEDRNQIDSIFSNYTCTSNP